MVFLNTTLTDFVFLMVLEELDDNQENIFVCFLYAVFRCFKKDRWIDFLIHHDSYAERFVDYTIFLYNANIWR